MNAFPRVLTRLIVMATLILATACQQQTTSPPSRPAKPGPINRAATRPASIFDTATPATTNPANPSASPDTSESQAPETAPSAATSDSASAAGGYGAERYRIVSQPDEIVTVLNNGLIVIAKRVQSPAVSIRAYVQAGSIYEGRWLGGGLSHLLEHLVAGGSTERRTEAEARSILQEIGNNSNAYTSTDQTVYFINTIPQHLEAAVDLLADWLLHARITEEEYQREYQVVQRELEMGRGEPSRQFWYMMQANRYRISPARIPVIGYQEVIQGLTRDDVYAYYKQAYVPNNMLFAIAGDVDPQQMLAAVQKHVDHAPPGRVFDHTLPDEPPILTPRTMVATMPRLGLARLDLGFETIKLSHEDLYALDLLSAALSLGESSILNEEIRDRRQLVRVIYASNYTPEYVEGTFRIYMELEPQNIEQATQAVLEVIEQIKRDGVDEQRLTRARTQLKAWRVRSMQTAEQIASSLAGDYLSTGDAHFTDQYLQRMDQVTPEQVRQVARKYLDPSRMLTTVMLPREFVGDQDLPAAEQILRAAAPTTRPGGEATTRPADQVTRIELENGTILLLKRLTNAPLVAVNMYAMGGLTAEDADTNGIGNLTMSLLPRGTTTRSAAEIAEFFDSIGGELTTQCGNNTWYWTATFLKDDFARGFEVFADVVLNPAFDEQELERMRLRVLATIRQQDAQWTSQAFRHFREKYFGPMNSPYQFQIIGTEQNVKKFSSDQLRQWYTQKVLRQRRVLAIYGDIDEQQARELAERYFGKGEKLLETRLAGIKPFQVPEASGVPTIEVERVEVQQTQQPLAGIVIGFRSDSVVGDLANFPMMVGDTMASGYDYPTGYLHEELRGRGLVYVVHGFNSPGRDASLPGTFMVYAGCDPRQVDDVIDLILLNIARLQGSDRDMQEDWFDRSKQLITTAEAMSQETAEQQAATAALDELYGLGYDFSRDFARRIDAVTLQQVRDVAANRLKACVVTVSTPQPEAVKTRPGQRQYREFPPVDLTPRGVQHQAAGGPQ